MKPKRKYPVVDVWNEMTLSELAMSANRDIDDVIKAFSMSDLQKRYHKNTIIVDKNILHLAIQKLGAKFKIVPRPGITVEKEENQDAVKRY